MSAFHDLNDRYQKFQTTRARDFYEVLGLKKDATQEEIKKAYRKVRFMCSCVGWGAVGVVGYCFVILMC